MIEMLMALLMDVIIGEYPNGLHPVVWMGKLIELIDGSYRRRSPTLDFLAGTACFLLTVSFALLLSKIPELLPFPLNLILEVYLLKSTFSIRSLYDHVRRTVRDDVEEMRRYVGLIVSRDVSKLDREHLISASIESLAENTVDSVISPLFYYALFGLSGAMVYRAINTLDAMVGYKDERYLHFGKLSARMDDILNFVPARISVLLFFPFNPKRVWRYYRMARFKINGDKPIACMSAILGVWLEKRNHYRFDGRKPTLKDVERALSVYSIVVAVYVTILILFTILPKIK